jgi:hypothetical protein
MNSITTAVSVCFLQCLCFARCLCLLGPCSLGLCLAATQTDGGDVGAIWNTAVQIEDARVLLPAPSLSDTMDAQQQEVVLRKIAGKDPMDRFLKDSIVAPLQLSRDNIKDDNGERIGHRVDLWFVAHGSLEEIRDHDLFTAMVDRDRSEGDDSGRALTSEELAARSLQVPSDGDLQQGFYRFSIGVIDRVLVQGVILGTTQITEVSHLTSFRLDERFRGDADFPNRWRHIDANPDDSVPYSGLAGYAKATRLLGHGDALLVECHAVVHEPGEWFHGPNLLSSKLPLATQDAVRSFRRAMSKDSD